MSIGAHTVTHPILSAVSLDRAQREISEGRAMLQGITGRAVEFFAYPNGVPGTDFGADHIGLVRRAGFTGALAAVGGAATAAADRFQLPRFAIRNTTGVHCAWVMRRALARASAPHASSGLAVAG
jgi:peptidoglycan/xylan/chitin deacetylase (PgdA/CDA1 family)